MLKLTNHTPLDSRLANYTDPHGTSFAVVILKGTFYLPPDQSNLGFANDQTPIIDADQYIGEPDNASVKVESDLAPYKAATDIIVCGEAVAIGGQAIRQLDASVAVNDSLHSIRVFGDRYWHRHSGTWQISEPDFFERMPLVFERAFGGGQASSPNQPSDLFSQNPVGMGYFSSQQPDREDKRLPNLEYPQQLIASPHDKPAPATFGVINRSWEPRISLAGSYDDQWQKERMPLLPLDFDERYYNCGNLVLPMLNGNENIVLTNMHESGPLRFVLPALDLNITVKIRGEETVHKPNLDTLFIEPSLRQVSLTWRLSVDCRREFLNIQEVIINRR